MTNKKILLSSLPQYRKRNIQVPVPLARPACFNALHVDDSIYAQHFRVLEINANSALLFNEMFTIRVIWEPNQFFREISIGQIVTIRSKTPTSSINGHIEIRQLNGYQRPIENLNIFELIPYSWVKDRNLVKRAATIFNELAEPHQLLFNAIFWNETRFERFCRQPSSMNGHHSEPNGNLRHTVEVAEIMHSFCLTRDFANKDLGVLAALLHDAGKADEYTQNGKGGWDLTDRGKLLGHKVSAVEWLISAVSRWNIQLPQDHYEGLLHIMTAIPYAPDWMGIRAPVTPESLLLSMADRLSGHDDLMMQTVNLDGGFGRYHKHLKYSPFAVRG